ncbi:MAG: hypothetical protein MI976_02510 [Pseudomonadales bacterium]|nr:hypothetical protein [Pseudomonadales bacterium]
MQRNCQIPRLALNIIFCFLSALSFSDQSFAEEPHVLDNQEKTSQQEVLIIKGKQLEDKYEISSETQVMIETPGTLGDPLGAVFSLPGVISSSSDGGEPAVRGSSPDDNIFIVDFMPAGYVFHEFSTSIFHESILQDFQMHASGYGTEYSNVTGAAFDIQLRDPKNQPLSGVADLSMLRSGIFLEAGLTDSSAFYFAYRKTLLHLFVPEDEEEDGVTLTNVPQDDDYQFKYQWRPNSRNKLTLSANGASDTADASFSSEADLTRSNPDFAGDASLDKTFNAQAIIWEHVGKTGHQFKAGFGHLKDNFRLSWGSDYFSETTFEQTSAKFAWSFPLTTSHLITFGGAAKDYKYRYRFDSVLFVCTEYDADCDLNRRDRISGGNTLEAKEYLGYIEDKWLITAALEWRMGIQWQTNDYTNETFNNPRTQLSYRFNDHWKTYLKAGRYNRFPNVEYILPDIGNPNLKSPESNHYSIGIENQLEDGWRWTLESYYKTFKNLPLALAETEPDADLLFSNDIKGKAYGLELFINKELTDDWYSWLAISYSRSERTNQRTNTTQEYHLDTPLVFNWVLNYQWTRKFNISWRWTLRSGAASTPIVGLQENPYFEDSVLPVYGEPYSERLPTYTRLDLRFEWDLPIGKLPGELILDIINATNRKNIVEERLDYDRVNSADDNVAIEREEGLGIIPALGYRLHF